MAKVLKNLLDDVKIYVGTYGKYNSGSLAGEWLTLGDYSDLQQFYDACAELHSDEADPEYMFQDYETPDIFKDLIGESFINSEIFNLAELLDGKDIEMIEAYMSATGDELSEDAMQKAENNFFGQYDSDTALAEDYADSTGMLDSIPKT